MYVIKHAFGAYLLKKAWFVFRKAVILHRDFFIVLDLRLTKRLVDYREVKLPFAFYRGSVSHTDQTAICHLVHLPTIFYFFL